MQLPLSIFYTANLGGDLHKMPKMQTFLRRLRGEFADNPAGGGQIAPLHRRGVLMLDLGKSCDPAAWPCTVTEGRSTLVVLDAMGFAAANVVDLLTPASRARLEGHITLALVDESHPFTSDDLAYTAGSDPQPPFGLHIDLIAVETTTLTKRVLRLADIQGDEVGVARLEATPDGRPHLAHHSVHRLPPGTHADPTIAGTVEFVEAEARYFEKRQGKG